MNKKQKLIFSCIAFYLLILVGCGLGGAALETRDTDPLGREHHIAEQQWTGNPNPYATTISSESTSIPSDQYPHTKAIQIQAAKYKFVVDDGAIQKHDIQFQMPEGVVPEREGPVEGQPAPEETVEQPSPTAEEQQHVTEPRQQEAPQQRAEQEQQQAQPQQEERTPQQEDATPQQDDGEAAQAEGISDIEARVIELTNVERRNNGLSDLQAHTALSNVARTKSNDMQENNYFSHTSPTYGSPFDMIRDFGISYNAAAENIAQGQRTAEQVVQAWMNSEGHRRNILNGEFTHIGVGYNENGHHWTQMFISQ